MSLSISGAINGSNVHIAKGLVETIDQICTEILTDFESDNGKSGFIGVGYYDETLPKLKDLFSDILHYHADLVDYRKKASREGKKGGCTDKKPRGILKAIRTLLQERVLDIGHDLTPISAAKIAEALWGYFQNNHSDIPFCVEGFKIYYINGKLEQMGGNEKHTNFHSIGFHRFKKHVSTILKEFS